jgi:hypothetical protein
VGGEDIWSSPLAWCLTVGDRWAALGAAPLVVDRLQMDELTATVLRRAFEL